MQPCCWKKHFPSPLYVIVAITSCPNTFCPSSFFGADDEGDGEDTGGGGSSSGGEEGSGAARRRQEKGFLEGGKADAFAKAFTKIMEKAGKEAGAAEAAAPILAVSLLAVRRRHPPVFSLPRRLAAGCLGAGCMAAWLLCSLWLRSCAGLCAHLGIGSPAPCGWPRPWPAPAALQGARGQGTATSALEWNVPFGI